MIKATRGNGEQFMGNIYDAGFVARNENDPEHVQWTREYAENMSNHGHIDVILELKA
jgi:hypothetical protein